jgi:hypothetical protein
MQCINGANLDRAGYIQHVIAQKQNMTIEAFEYRHSLEHYEELFTLYYPKGRNKQGNIIEAEVVAYFQFKDQQILKIHGQVRLLSGDYAEVDM